MKRIIEDPCQIIIAPDQYIPKGSELVEAYETKDEIIVIFNEKELPDGHNCDVMGCTSLSHVKYRFRKGF